MTGRRPPARKRSPPACARAATLVRLFHRTGQQALGEKAGLRQETISLIENGNSATRIKTLLAVFAVLDLEFHIGPRSKGGLRGESDF